MQTYNKIMQAFWLVIGVIIIIFVTYKGITDGFQRWAPIYILGALAISVFLLRRFMMKRMSKHQDFLDGDKTKK